MASKGELTKERILSEATQLFHEKGFGTTSISDILSATELKKGSLYFHFPSKEEIGLAVLEKAKEGFKGAMDSSLVGATPGECLTHYFESVFKKHKKSKFHKGCLFGNTALEVSDSEEGYAQIIESIFAQWLERLEDVIADAQGQGQVRDDLDANMLAHHIVATIEGGIMLSKLQKNGNPLRICLDSLKVFLKLEN